MCTDTIKQLQTVFRNAGLKITHQRIEIYKELVNAKDHPTAEMLYNRLLKKLPTISLDTVYRTLTTFVNHKLANRVETPANLSRFEAAQIPHHHLICTTCNSITDFFWPELTKIQLPQTITKWGEPENMVVVVYGTCSSCQKNTGQE